MARLKLMPRVPTSDVEAARMRQRRHGIWRIDFEAAHSLDKTSRTQTNARRQWGGDAGTEEDLRVPSAFDSDV